MIYVTLDSLTAFTAHALSACELPSRRALSAAQALCYADSVGMDSHGIANLESSYVARLRDGTIVADAELHTVFAAQAITILDAGKGLGLWVGIEAMDLAVALAKRHGVGAVAVRNSTHLGAIGFYARRATTMGCVGLAMSNCGSQRIAPAPAGGAPVLGTNPLGIAVPGANRPAFVLDMSTTVMPTGRIRQAAAAGERLPPGVLADGSGAPETDPNAYDAGTATLLWLGSHPETGAYKGFGLGLAVDLLAGLLSGAAAGPLSEPGMTDGDVGHFFLALDIRRFRALEDFTMRFDELAASLHAASPLSAASYPGEPEARVWAERRRDGVPLPTRVLEMLGRVASSCSLSTEELVMR